MDDTFSFSLIMPVLGYYISSQIDLTEKFIESFLVVAFFLEVIGCLYVLFQTRAAILKNNDETKLTYYAKDFWGKKKKLKQRDLIETTHKDYDLQQWRNDLFKFVFGFGITGFLFFSSNLHSILLLGVLTSPFSIIESKIIQIHFFKSPATLSRSRPFGDPASFVGVISNQVKTLKKDYEEITSKQTQDQAQAEFVIQEAELVRKEIEETKRKQAVTSRHHS